MRISPGQTNRGDASSRYLLFAASAGPRLKPRHYGVGDAPVPSDDESTATGAGGSCGGLAAGRTLSACSYTRCAYSAASSFCQAASTDGTNTRSPLTTRAVAVV